MSTPPEPSFVASSISAAVAAILTIAQAVPNIDKRLSRVRDIEREVGSIPSLIRCLYVHPQWFYKISLIAISFIGVLMVLLFLYGVLRPDAPMPPALERFKEGGIWVVVAWLLVGGGMYVNSVSRFWIAILKCTRPWPIRHLLGIEAWSEHPAWPSLQNLVELNENAKPLLISEENANVFADWLLQFVRMPGEAPRNRAAPPQMPPGDNASVFREKVANALLVGCLIEEAHHRSSTFPERDWEGFYDSIGQLAVQDDLLSSATLYARYLDEDYYTELLNALNERLRQTASPPTAVHPPRPPVQGASPAQPDVPDSPALRETLRNVFVRLVRDYGGTAAALAPRENGWLKSRFEIASENVERLQCFRDESMRAQFLKLANVWGVWTNLPVHDFIFPFSLRIAALFLDRGVILTTDDVKALSFSDPEDRQVLRAAEKMVIARAIGLIEPYLAANQSWLPRQCMTMAGNLQRWWFTYELDFRIWDCAQRLHQNQQIPGGSSLTRWKAAFGQVSRVK
jgi:hypothetical protein